MHTDLPFIVAAPGHPSLDGAIVRFCDDLRAEMCWSGRRGATVPTSSLVRRLAVDVPGLRLAAVHDGEIVGLAKIDAGAPAGPELLLAVAAPWRGRGVALALGRTIVERAAARGVERIVVHTGGRTVELRQRGADLGFQVVDLGGGRLDLIRTRPPAFRSA